MIPIDGGITEAWSQKTLIQMCAEAIVLTSSGDTALTLADTNAKNQRLYKISAAAAGDEYFYIDVNGKYAYKLAGFKISVGSAITLVGTLQHYRDGTWVDNSAYDFSFDATKAQKMQGIYPFEEAIYGMPSRIKATVSASGDIFCQAVQG